MLFDGHTFHYHAHLAAVKQVKIEIRLLTSLHCKYFEICFKEKNTCFKVYVPQIKKNY